MRQVRFLLVGLTFFGIMQVSLFGQGTQEPIPAPSPPIPPPGQSLKGLDGQRIVFVINGAGESTMVSDRFQMVKEDFNVNMNIQMVPWCTSANGARAHYKDTAAQLKSAAWLAGQTTRVRKECPNAEIYYVGHSTGAHIALVAAEMSPEKSINRIILIASAVNACVDLRPALRASRNGIDHFWSKEDAFLERVAESYGFPDGSKGRAAGQAGFQVPPFKDAEGFDAYKNLRQNKWSEELPRTGGHNAWISKAALRSFIIPLIAPESAVPPPPRLRS